MSHVEDRWETVINGQRTRTPRYGSGSRWKARWVDPDGQARSKAFTRRGDAERFLATVTVDVMRGAYVDPRAGKVLLKDFALAWLEAQTNDPSTREAMRSRYKVHILPAWGTSSSRASVPRRCSRGSGSCRTGWLRATSRRSWPTSVPCSALPSRTG